MVSQSSNRTRITKSGRRRALWLWRGRSIGTFKGELAAFAWMLDYSLLLEVLATRSTCHNTSIFSMNIEMLLEIRDLFEAFFAAEDRACVRFFTSVRPHMIEQALNSFEEFPAARLVAWVVSYGLRYLVTTTCHLVVDLSLEPELAKKGRFRHRMPLAYLI